jgi:8-amino-3,8-dideoxy-alpha-D-manno-octulosonate transaminase
MPGFEIFGDEERKEVQDVLETGVLFRYGFDQVRQDHWKAKTFEAEFAQRCGVAHCHLCSSGTAALSIALASCGVGAGDEVIVPPFTFIATIEAVLNAGAVPIFAEIDETLCLAPEGISAAISPRTKAVITVHMCGAMARIDAIQALCNQNGLILIEDACQAVGGTYKGQALGSFGQMGCFSFDAVKTITCGEGGAIITNDTKRYQLADAFADHGHDHIGQDRGLEEHPILGVNYRICELNAAVGLAQIRKLDMILERQRLYKSILKETLSPLEHITFRDLPDPEGDSATFLSILLPDETLARRAAQALGKGGIDGCFFWYDNSWHYLKNWDHLKKLKTAAKLPLSLLDSPPDYSTIQLPQSDNIMGRTISMLIKLSWDEAMVQERAQNMATILQDI